MTQQITRKAFNLIPKNCKLLQIEIGDEKTLLVTHPCEWTLEEINEMIAEAAGIAKPKRIEVLR